MNVHARMASMQVAALYTVAISLQKWGVRVPLLPLHPIPPFLSLHPFLSSGDPAAKSSYLRGA